MKSSPKSFEPAQFINVALSAEQRKELKGWQPNVEELDDALLKTLESGYKITLRYDERNACYACWLATTESGHVNGGLILAGRGSTPVRAIKQAYYIHTRLFDGEWGEHYRDMQQSELDD